jgi:hypothetical protein
MNSFPPNCYCRRVSDSFGFDSHNLYFVNVDSDTCVRVKILEIFPLFVNIIGTSHHKNTIFSI